jgi:hypothetical protein
MTEQHPKIIQVTQDIIEMSPTADIVQMPATQDIVQSPPTQDILQMSAQMVDVQPLKTSPGRKHILGVNRMERIQESRLTILER